MSRHTRALFLAAAGALGLTACTDGGPAAVLAPSREPVFAAVKFQDANATANWSDLATSLA